MGEVSEWNGPDGDPARPRIEGLAVDLAARICGLARPAQVLMSAAVADSARQRVPSNSFDQPRFDVENTPLYLASRRIQRSPALRNGASGQQHKK